MKKINKKIDLLIVFLFLGIIALISLKFKLKPLITFALYTLLSSTYLILREKKNFLKIFLSTFSIGLIGTFIVDFILIFNNVWRLTREVFPLKIFGFYPLIDNVIVNSSMAFFIFIFYEHFLDDERHRVVSKNFLWGLVPLLLVFISITIGYITEPMILKIPYTYLFLGIISIFFPLLMILYQPKLLNKLFKVVAFFFIVWFTLELVCLKTKGKIRPKIST